VTDTPGFYDQDADDDKGGTTSAGQHDDEPDVAEQPHPDDDVA